MKVIDLTAARRKRNPERLIGLSGDIADGHIVLQFDPAPTVLRITADEARAIIAGLELGIRIIEERNR